MSTQQQGQNVTNATSVTLGTLAQPVRLSYLNVFVARPPLGRPNDDPQYSVAILIPKGNAADLAAIQNALNAAAAEGVATKWNGKAPQQFPQFKWALRDGDLEKADKPEYANCYFINAKNTRRPQVVDLNRQPILNESAIGSGDWGAVAVSFFPFANQGAAGIGVSLNAIMKTADGERLTGEVSVESAFGHIGNPATAPLGGVNLAANVMQPQQFAPQAQPQQFAQPQQPQQFAQPQQPQQFAPQAQPQQFAPQAQPQQFAPQAQPQQFAPQAQPGQVINPLTDLPY